MHPAAPAAPINQIDALRRLQRRLLFGGGGLISILIVLTAVASLVGGIGEFHSRERQTFQEAQSALDYFLSQRDQGPWQLFRSESRPSCDDWVPLC